MDNCIFCKIVGGELPSHTIYEDDYFKVIMDIAPATVGHALIISKVHAANILELPGEHASRLISLVCRVSRAILDETGAAGFNLLQNNGADAGQEVFHFHAHIIPRRPDDGLRIKAPMKDKPGHDDLGMLAKSLAGRLSA